MLTRIFLLILLFILYLLPLATLGHLVGGPKIILLFVGSALLILFLVSLIVDRIFLSAFSTRRNRNQSLQDIVSNICSRFGLAEVTIETSLSRPYGVYYLASPKGKMRIIVGSKVDEFLDRNEKYAVFFAQVIKLRYLKERFGERMIASLFLVMYTPLLLIEKRWGKSVLLMALKFFYFPLSYLFDWYQRHKSSVRFDQRVALSSKLPRAYHSSLFKIYDYSYQNNLMDELLSLFCVALEKRSSPFGQADQKSFVLKRLQLIETPRVT